MERQIYTRKGGGVMSKFIPNSFQIPNSVIDELLAKLTCAELKCYLYVVRKTKGWNKDSDNISVSQFMEVTGLSNRSVITACESLVQMGLLERSGGERKLNTYSVKAFEIPQAGEKSSSEQSGENFSQTGEKSSSDLVKKVHTQNNNKNTIQNHPPISPQGESATPANGKINAENIPLPDYVDRETWIAYCRMRKAKRAEIKTEDTIKRCLGDLKKLCGGSPDLARAILDQSIANTYTGLFAPKSLPNRTVNSSASNDPFADNGTWGVGRKLNVDPSLIPEYLR